MGSIGHISTAIDPQDIDLLNRYFHTKTIFGVDLGCNEEARQALQTSLTNPSIHHAITALKALRGNFEKFAGPTTSVVQPIPNHAYGLQQYCEALRGLATDLSSNPGPGGLKSALICCQIFISVEQVRENYAVMAQHIIHALKIMHENQARPGLDAAKRLVPAHHEQLPFVDAFIIKLFAAPCGFAERSSGVCAGEDTVGPIEFRSIAPNMRAELMKIAASTLDFLDKVVRVESVETAVQLLTEKLFLLESLRSWKVKIEAYHPESSSANSEPLMVSFTRLFHQILKIVLLSTLERSLALQDILQIENEKLKEIARFVGKRVTAYRACE